VCSALARPVWRANDLSGLVARDLSGFIWGLEVAQEEGDGATAGDPEDEVRRSVWRLARRTAVARGGGAVAWRYASARFAAMSNAMKKAESRG